MEKIKLIGIFIGFFTLTLLTNMLFAHFANKLIIVPQLGESLKIDLLPCVISALCIASFTAGRIYINR